MKLRISMLLFVTVVSCGSASAQTVRNIATSVKVSDYAINTIIDKQWVRQGWDSFFGNVAGCNYVIDLPSPTVVLTLDHGTLTLSASITSSNCGGPWDVNLSPTIAIPSGQVSTAQVKMWLVDLYDLIDGLPIPNWVKGALERELGDRWGLPDVADSIDAFPAALLGGLSSDWFDQRSVNLYYSNPFEFAWQVDDGFLTLLPSVNIQAGQGATVSPDFKARFFLGASDWIDLWSNIKTKVTTVRVFDLAGYHQYTIDPNPAVYTIKYHGDPASEWIAIDLKGVKLNFNQIFIAWVLFETDHTFYVRKYKIFTNSTGWTFATNERYN